MKPARTTEGTGKKSHRGMVADWKRDPEFKVAYDELEAEYAVLRELLRARRDAGLTQAEVAERMGTKAPAVTRLETSLSQSGPSPTLMTLKKYAKAVDCHLEIRLVPTRKTRRAG